MKIGSFESHEAADAYPLMSAAELDALADDIAKHGLQTPVVLYEGKLLDGRNRVLACGFAGVDVRTVTLEGPFDLDAWVASQNLYRRHLTASQRAMIAARLLPAYQEQAQERQRGAGARGAEGGRGKRKPSGSSEPKGSDEGKATARAAKAQGVSRASVQRAKKVLDSRNEEAIRAIDEGRATVRGVTAPAQADGPRQRAAAEHGATLS